MLCIGPLQRPLPVKSGYIIKEVRALLIAGVAAEAPRASGDAQSPPAPEPPAPAAAAVAAAAVASETEESLRPRAEDYDPRLRAPGGVGGGSAGSPGDERRSAGMPRRVSADRREPSPPHVEEQPWFDATPIATPCSLFEELKASRRSWGIDSLGTFIVEVELHSGVVGVGVSLGGAPGCSIVEEHYSRFVEGQDVHNIELMWEQMYRSAQVYGSQGLMMHALSAIDLALWDALGKAKGEPVYNLLGGKTKER